MKVEDLTPEELSKVLQPVNRKQLKSLGKSDLIELVLGEQDLRIQAQKELEKTLEEKYFVEGKYIIIRSKMFLASSEKGAKVLNKNAELTDNPEESDVQKNEKKENENEKKKPRKPKKPRTLLPSERYPGAVINDKQITLEELPCCPDCAKKMKDTGLTSVREKLSVIPKKFVIDRYHYHTYGCKDCGTMTNTPTVPQIIPGSAYSDKINIDIGLSKFCDLLPINRYVAMAGRGGFPGLPANSLIDQTHHLSFFMLGVYKMIKEEVQGDYLNFADETTHRMLEGSGTSRWYLWEFSNLTSCYFECHNTRSGDVASKFFDGAKLLFLMSDVYSGYSKALRISNEKRREKQLSEIISLFCNAHARRKFVESLHVTKDAEYFIRKYEEIYALENEMNNSTKSHQKKLRKGIRSIMKKMKKKADKLRQTYSSKSIMGKACFYFSKNFKGLINFTYKVDLPIDNNHAERLLRSPVVGRKTWLGTHSKQGAETTAILFSIVQSCHLNNVNPREYFPAVVKCLHETRKGFTPSQYVKIKEGANSLPSSIQ